MKLILPIDITNISIDIKLPFTLFSKDGINVVLEKFTLSDKEWFFDIENLKKDDDKYGVRYSCRSKKDKEYISYIIRDCSAFILANCKIKISTDNNNPSLLEKAQCNLDFILKVILGRGFVLSKISDAKKPYNNSITILKDKFILSRRDQKIVDKDTIKKIVKFMEKLSLEENENKKDILYFLVSTAMRQTNSNVDSKKELGIAGAFYVIILDNLFLNKKDIGKGKKLAESLLKCKENINDKEVYRKRIENMYNNRNDLFHDGKNKFTLADVKFLEEEASWAIMYYFGV